MVQTPPFHTSENASKTPHIQMVGDEACEKDIVDQIVKKFNPPNFRLVQAKDHPQLYLELRNLEQSFSAKLPEAKVIPPPANIYVFDSKKLYLGSSQERSFENDRKGAAIIIFSSAAFDMLTNLEKTSEMGHELSHVVQEFNQELSYAYPTRNRKLNKLIDDDLKAKNIDPKSPDGISYFNELFADHGSVRLTGSAAGIKAFLERNAAINQKKSDTQIVEDIFYPSDSVRIFAAQVAEEELHHSVAVPVIAAPKPVMRNGAQAPFLKNQNRAHPGGKVHMHTHHQRTPPEHSAAVNPVQNTHHQTSHL